MGNLGRNFLLAMLLVAFVVPTASAGLVQVYINKSEDLVTSEDPIFIEQGKDFTIIFHIGGPYRIESGDDNLSVYNLNMDVHFLNDDRAKIKLEINNPTGSVIKEIKEYTNY